MVGQIADRRPSLTPSHHLRALSHSCDISPITEQGRLALGLNTLHGVKRWNGRARTVTDWDALKKDDHLWVDSGDCNIHLHAPGRSRRGPSFRLHSELICARQCHQYLPTDSIRTGHSLVEVYIPAPSNITRQEAFDWHITTRNVFAWVLDEPLVGASLGTALIDLLERLLLIRPATAENLSECLMYAEKMGYLDFTHSPDYALSLLRFAEHFNLRELWIDAFAHCVGMNDSLSLSQELGSVSQATRALINNASLEMHLRIEKATLNLRDFLFNDLSSPNLGLSSAERTHLDDFRSFVMSYYNDKEGYWPPDDDFLSDKETLHSLRQDFAALYEHLADTLPLNDDTRRPAVGGLCVLQNIHEYDSRHAYEPLPYPLPLLPPTTQSPNVPRARRSLLHLRMKSGSRRQTMLLDARAAHVLATNSKHDTVVPKHPLVSAYDAYEASWLTTISTLNFAEARKVRWMLIYCAYQTIRSISQCPAEVRDARFATYHMCCSVQESLPCVMEESLLSCHPAIRASVYTRLSKDEEATDFPQCSMIEPDCVRADYFEHDETELYSREVKRLSLWRRASIRMLERSLSAKSLRRQNPLTLMRRSVVEMRTSYKTDTAASSPQSGEAEDIEDDFTRCRSPILDSDMVLGPFELPACEMSESVSYDAFEAVTTKESAQMHMPNLHLGRSWNTHSRHVSMAPTLVSDDNSSCCSHYSHDGADASDAARSTMPTTPGSFDGRSFIGEHSGLNGGGDSIKGTLEDMIDRTIEILQ